VVGLGVEFEVVVGDAISGTVGGVFGKLVLLHESQVMEMVSSLSTM
jgi:hypothetical protein